MVTDIPMDANVDQGVTKMGFNPSTPPEGSHRYIFLVYTHANKIGGEADSDVSARASFKISAYAQKNGLGNPKAINYYFTKP